MAGATPSAGLRGAGECEVAGAGAGRRGRGITDARAEVVQGAQDVGVAP